MLSQVLACDATLGYEELYNVQVLRFNGEPVRNLRHLAQLCLACDAPFMRFDLDYDVRRPLVVLEYDCYVCYILLLWLAARASAWGCSILRCACAVHA